MIGVVADDTTGANDIGLMFSNNHYAVKVVTFDKDKEIKTIDSDVLIIDTDSRLDDPDDSYSKVYQATKQLEKLGCSHYFNKTCSVFRGNIGRELDAMLDALGEEFAVISLAFPKNGRQTVNGIHTVHGKLLEESEFAKDPVHPMHKSKLVDILEEKTKRKVTSVHLEVVRKGVSALSESIESARSEGYNYCIIDAENQEDLTIIAEAVHEYKVLCGSSAVAEELPKFMNLTLVNNPTKDLNISDPNGVLVVSGSLTPQTKAQTIHLVNQGMPAVVLDSRKVFTLEERKSEIARVFNETRELLVIGKDVLVMADNNEDVVSQTKEFGRRLNIDPLTTSKMISAALADIATQLADETGYKRLVVAGGDTSGTVSRKLGITGNYVLQEIETGLPSGLSTGRQMLIVLKSGSFGKPDFLERAVQHLKNLSS